MTVAPPCLYNRLLQGLTQVLVSAVMPIMSIYRLPHGQYGYSGHVINLPQDVASFANSLPCLPSELDVIVVRREGASQSHHDFRVRRSVMHQALLWLVTNNQYYRANNIHIDANALAQLLQDGNLSQLNSVTIETTAAPAETSASNTSAVDTTTPASDTESSSNEDTKTSDPYDAQLSLDELRDMVGRQGEAFSNRVLHYASSLRGTRQYWYRQ